MTNILWCGYGRVLNIEERNERIFSKDYHVILVDKTTSPASVYDFDSMLSFPISANEYLRLGIRDETTIVRRYHR